MELEDVNEISISLPFELTDTYLKKYELNKVEKEVHEEIDDIFKQVLTENKSDDSNIRAGLIEADSKKLETLNNDYNLITKDEIYNVSFDLRDLKIFQRKIKTRLVYEKHNSNIAIYERDGWSISFIRQL